MSNFVSPKDINVVSGALFNVSITIIHMTSTTSSSSSSSPSTTPRMTRETWSATSLRGHQHQHHHHPRQHYHAQQLYKIINKANLNIITCPWGCLQGGTAGFVVDILQPKQNKEAQANRVLLWHDDLQYANSCIYINSLFVSFCACPICCH